ncbi:ubiquitin-specific protease ubp15, partial [Dimargaris xerosporica]
MDVNKTFVESEMQNGDIICFQRVLTEAETAQVGELDTVVKYFDSYANDLEVAFTPLEKEGVEAEKVEPIVLRLNKRLRYDEVAQRVAARLGCDPLKMRFFVYNLVLGKRHIIKRSENMSLSEMIRVWDLSVADKILFIQYEILPVPVDELESKQGVMVHWLNGTVKTVVPVEVFVNEDETVGAVMMALSEALAKQTLPVVAPSAMRLYLVANKKIFSLLEPSTPVADLLKGPMVYGEAVSADERALDPNDMLMHVFHFHRDVYMVHSAPFYLLVKANEPMADTLARLQQRLGVGEKEFARIKVALVAHNSAEPPKYLESDVEDSLSALVGE